MSSRLIGQLFITGAAAAALAVTPLAAGAQSVNTTCNGFANNTSACSTNTTHSAFAGASNIGNPNVPVGVVSGNGFVTNGGQTNSASAAAQTDSQNGSFNSTGTGTHEVVVNGRTFTASGSGGSAISLGVGGASNTGGAPD